MGRREKPVDPEAGPVQRLAHELRLLREKAGKPPYREMAERAGYSTTALSQAAAGDQLPSLALVRAYAEVLDADPDEWERRWREADAEVRAPSTEERAPYRGLARFEPGDSDLFFGRDKQVGELLGLVRAHRFAAVSGPSGSGKSSLLRAGLIPALRQAQGSDRPAVIRVLTPGEQPARTHERALVPKDGGDGEDGEDGGQDTWVIVDQFEELFTLCPDRAERDRFLDLLLSARDRSSRLRVAIAVRGDFYGHCGTHPGLAEAVGRATLLIGPMGREELRDVITRPATAEGLNVERALTARVIDEVTDQPGALPMLSHALLETWRRRRGRTLTLAAYEEAGGVRGALAATAEQVYGDLAPEQARIARRVLLRLIAPGDGAADTRRPASRPELGPDARDVLERLAAARLVTLDGDTVELAHEVLITGWPRLAGWIEEGRERLHAQRLLGESARAWDQLDRDAGVLYRGARLVQAAELFGGSSRDDLAELERAFLDASRAARDAEREAEARATRRTRMLTAGLSAFLVLALAAGLLAWQRGRTSEEEAAKAAARRLATVAAGLHSADPRTAARLSVAAWRLAPLTESRSALLEALARPERDAFTDPQTGENVRRFLTGQGRSLVTVTDGRVTVRNVADHRVTAAYRLPAGTEVAEGGPDGRFLVVIGQDGDQLWNLASGRTVADLGDTVDWAPDGSAYLTGPSDGAGAVRVRRTGDGRALFTTDVPRALTTAAVGPGGRLLALCTAGGAPQVWDTVQGRKLAGAWEKARGNVCGTGSGADGGSRLLRFSADGRRLAAVLGNTSKVWNVSGGREVADFASAGTTGFTDAVLSPDGEFLATADDEEIAVWRLANGGGQVFHQPLAGAEVRYLAWDPDTSRRTLRYLDNATVRTYDVSDRLDARWQGTPADATALSPDGSVLATATRSGSGYRFELRATGTRAVLARTTLGPLPTDAGGGPPQLAYSPDGRSLAVADTVSSHGSLRQRFSVWDVRAHQVRTSFETSGAADRTVYALALGPGGRTLLAVRSTGGDSAAEVWDTRSHRRTATLNTVHQGSLALRPDGRLLADSADRYAELPSGRVRGHALADGQPVTALAFSPDGTRLAAGDSTGHVTLWDGDLRTRRGLLTGTSDTASASAAEAVGALAFSPDGSTLAVGGQFGTLRLWDTAGQQQLGTDLPTAGDEIDTLAFTDDGATLYAGGLDVLLQGYPVAPDDIVRVLCSRAGGGLTGAQWRTYVPDVSYRQVCPGTR